MDRRTRNFKIIAICMVFIFFYSSNLMSIAFASGIPSNLKEKRIFERMYKYEEGFKKPSMMGSILSKSNDAQEKAIFNDLNQSYYDGQNSGQTSGSGIANSIAQIGINSFSSILSFLVNAAGVIGSGKFAQQIVSFMILLFIHLLVHFAAVMGIAVGSDGDSEGGRRSQRRRKISRSSN